MLPSELKKNKYQFKNFTVLKIYRFKLLLNVHQNYYFLENRIFKSHILLQTGLKSIEVHTLLQ